MHILDTSYNESYTICPKLNLVTLNDAVPECRLDFHESYIPSSPAADYIVVTTYNSTQANLTSVDGPSDGWVWDSLFYKINIFTGEILFLWSALGSGIAFNESREALKNAGTRDNPWDWFHINSVQASHGGYLVSGRNTWTVYMVSGEGDLYWRSQVNPQNTGIFHIIVLTREIPGCYRR